MESNLKFIQSPVQFRPFSITLTVSNVHELEMLDRIVGHPRTVAAILMSDSSEEEIDEYTEFLDSFVSYDDYCTFFRQEV